MRAFEQFSLLIEPVLGYHSPVFLAGRWCWRSGRNSRLRVSMPNGKDLQKPGKFLAESRFLDDSVRRPELHCGPAKFERQARTGPAMRQEERYRPPGWSRVGSL